LNVAGFLHSNSIKPEKRISDLNLANLSKTFSINTFGPALLTSKLLQLLKGSPHSVIANLSAKVGSIEDNKSGGWYSYRSSKAAQNMLTKNLAIELSMSSQFSTLCVSLHPGTVDTDLSKPFLRNINKDNLFTSEDCVENLIKVINNLKEEDNGNFLDWSGKKIPW
jgi:NAD(P)-dependent dehydrogenase (short-subunit alcohol dehydrogenase family)